MIRIGIIGAENSHTAAIAKTLNVERQVEGFAVEYVWGETAAFAQAAADQGQIPHIVAEPADMLGKIDALIVDHRHARHHLAPALPFVEAGIPTFIDKPFCYRSAEGEAFLARARELGTPVTCFSVIPHQESFRTFTAKLPDLGPLKAATSYGPCDLDSPHGGVFFYGIHQVEFALQAFGYDVCAASLIRHGDNGIGTLHYADGKLVVMHFIKQGCAGFFAHAVGEQGAAEQRLVFDANAYLNGIREFTTMFATRREPTAHELILKPVYVLEALERALASGKTEAVSGC
jgi:predicted dehydrogenase